jgi:hypothetical protein
VVLIGSRGKRVRSPLFGCGVYPPESQKRH